MKKIYLCLAAALTLGLAACSSSSDDTENKQTGTTEIITPVKTAEVAFSSNGIDLATGTRAEGDFEKWDAIYRQYGPYVETNLVINNENAHATNSGDWIESNLSIHFRAATNATVTLAVPPALYKNLQNGVVAGTIQKSSTATPYTVKIADTDVTVTVTITYNADAKDADGKVIKAGDITIAVTNVTSEVINALEAKYGDGLNINIRNFYNGDATRGKLKALFEGSSNINFTTDPVYVISKGYAVNDNNNVISTTDFGNACSLKPENTKFYNWMNVTDYTTDRIRKAVYSNTNGKSDPADGTHPVVKLTETGEIAW